MVKELDILLLAIKEAGTAILKIERSKMTSSRKLNLSIVTQADLEANQILKNRLLASFPEDAWLSEECIDTAQRLTSKRVWVVDPIDGTKEYVAGVPEYALSVALVEAGEPIIAAIFNPATNQLFHAVKNQGAWQGNKKLQMKGFANTADLLLLASRTEYARGEWKAIETHCQVKQMGSIAYKLALIAAGEAHATFSRTPKNEWDIAAGVLLVTEAGGIVTDKKKEAFVFNRKDLKVNGIVASAATVYEEVYTLMHEHDH